MPINVIQINFDPTKWTAGFGPAGTQGSNGYNAYPVYFDKDGTTGWAFEWFGAGFARFNLSDGSPIVDDALYGSPGSGHTLWTHEDGSDFFGQDDQGHYYTLPDFGTLLYKSHVTNGPTNPSEIFNGYMTEDAPTLGLDISPVLTGTMEDWANPIVPAADGNRYLFFANQSFLFSTTNGFAAVDVAAMSIVGKFTTPTAQANAAFMDKNGVFWGVTSSGGLNFSVNNWNTTGGILFVDFATPNAGPAFVAGETVVLSGFGVGIPNGVSVVISATGLTSTHFQAPLAVGNNTGSSGGVQSRSVLLVEWNPLSGQSGGILNATLHKIFASTLGTVSGFEFAGYDPNSHSMLLSNSNFNTGDLVSIDLATLTRNTFLPDDYTTLYSSTFDAPISALQQGVASDGKQAVPGDPSLSNTALSRTQLGGILNLIDPVALTTSQTFNITSAINAASPPTPVPLSPNWNVLYGAVNFVAENASNVVTITGPNNLQTGDVVSFSGLTNATWLGSVTVLSASPTQWTANDPTLHGAYPNTAEPNYTSTPPYNALPHVQGTHLTVYPPFGNMQWNRTLNMLAVTYESGGSPVYLLQNIPSPAPPPAAGFCSAPMLFGF